ncbi:DMT family transporter [Clostridium frigidicarnis]|uniref:Permease of the drug/metabolite transporter (DMT) superfamily n=1 Tax=Clostridium frigidicarnis TaxID=84698 RepID=A0A1I0YIH2_9CLOT|nr:DMT family transporter [Clostridium frigidicarnis]SFB12687.1 Permease of the drug/metabolite transporter (DMT) superfamily [Clostridium frigidicarnis]
MNEKNRSLMELHLAVLLFGLSGLFGKFISLPSMVIVWGRVLFSSIFLMCVLFYFKKDLKLKKRNDYIYLIIMGVILAIHWTTFFQAIQMSTVAIGLLTFSTFPVFTTFLEPYFFKEKINAKDIIIAIITFLGVIFVVPKFNLGDDLTKGAIWGIISGFTYAILSMLNRKYVEEYSSVVIAFYEQSIATLVLVPAIFLYRPNFTGKDIGLLILLGIVFTGIAHTLFINSLKNIKTQTAGIISSLEPVYGIILAVLLLGELPTIREVIGGVIILGTSFYSTITVKKINAKTSLNDNTGIIE